MAWSDLIAKIFTIKQELNPLLTAPWVNHRIFRKDWLHAVDQGVGPDFLGNLFVLLMQKMPSNNMDERVAHLEKHMFKFYEEISKTRL